MPWVCRLMSVKLWVQELHPNTSPGFTLTGALPETSIYFSGRILLMISASLNTWNFFNSFCGCLEEVDDDVLSIRHHSLTALSDAQHTLMYLRPDHTRNSRRNYVYGSLIRGGPLRAADLWEEHQSKVHRTHAPCQNRTFQVTYLSWAS